MNSFITFTLSLLVAPSMALAINFGNDGGGGHFCKSQAMLFVNNVTQVLADDQTLANKYPEWTAMQAVINPQTNPGFVVKITDRPIKNCRNTANALACSHPQENVMEIFCGEDGWNSKTTLEKYKQVAHELYWWTKLDDANYFYSSKLAADVVPVVEESASYSQRFLILSKGEITSTEVFLNKVKGCRLLGDDDNYWSWKELKDKYVCQIPANDRSGNSLCRVGVYFDFTVAVNNKFSAKIDYSNDGSGYSTVLKGTEINKNDMKFCKDLIKKDKFAEVSMKWLNDLEEVKRGIVKKSLGDCYTRDFRFTYDPTTNNMTNAEFGNTKARCL